VRRQLLSVSSSSIPCAIVTVEALRARGSGRSAIEVEGTHSVRRPKK
jgi:hypothetical protein